MPQLVSLPHYVITGGSELLLGADPETYKRTQEPSLQGQKIIGGFSEDGPLIFSNGCNGDEILCCGHRGSLTRIAANLAEHFSIGFIERIVCCKEFLQLIIFIIFWNV